jgi:antitoxin MazE
MRAIKVFFSKISNSPVVRFTTRPRFGWDEQFQAMAQHGDDQLLDEPIATHWDRSKWKW